MKDNKEFIKGIYEKYDEYLKEEGREKKMEKDKNNNVESIQKDSKKFTPIKNVKSKEFKKGSFVKNNFFKMLSAAAVFAIVLSSVIISKNIISENGNNGTTQVGKTTTSDKLSLNKVNDFQTFYNIVKENDELQSKYAIDDGIVYETEDRAVTSEQAAKSSGATSETTITNSATEDYSKTNIQVENVDEADKVKTNGKYIFSISSKKVIIVDIQDKTNMKQVAEISFENENFNPQNLYIYKDKIVVLGNENGYSKSKSIIRETIGSIYKKGVYKQKAVAIVYDISKIEEPKEERRVEIEGNYLSSRMIDGNIYFTANKTIASYDIVKKDIEDLNENIYKPTYTDTLTDTREKMIEFDRIYYFDHIERINYLTLGGFSLNNKNEVDIETFLGAGSDIYCSTENMYVVKAKNVYDYDTLRSFGEDTKIIKFALNDGKIDFKAEATIEGGINNQFSMDEKDGYFRIATTVGRTYNMDNSTSNSLYILDKNLKEVGRLDGIAKGEKIYSVRYAGDKAYVVTFKEIDPLFVIDLSDVRNPKILGELKIPGYSTYLHPYDENHLIGFGYDTKSNDWGTGVVRDGLKMSMFDITDLKNPKEMFSVKIGNNRTSSDLTNDHKALLFSKEKNFIAFPISTYENGKQEYKAQVYDIDLEKGFNLRGEIAHEYEGKTYGNYNLKISRILYSQDNFYTVSNALIKSSDMNSLKEITKLEIK